MSQFLYENDDNNNNDAKAIANTSGFLWKPAKLEIKLNPGIVKQRK